MLDFIYSVVSNKCISDWVASFYVVEYFFLMQLLYFLVWVMTWIILARIRL
jgi:hypothetical protein